LTTLTDCRREASRLYRLALSDSMSVAKARQLVAILQAVGTFIEAGELERRLELLEADDA
jgi:hypothetical protein